jgi:hypothetical protein
MKQRTSVDGSTSGELELATSRTILTPRNTACSGVSIATFSSRGERELVALISGMRISTGGSLVAGTALVGST